MFFVRSDCDKVPEIPCCPKHDTISNRRTAQKVSQLVNPGKARFVQMKFDEKQRIKAIISPQAKYNPGKSYKGKEQSVTNRKKKKQTDHPGSSRNPQFEPEGSGEKMPHP